MEFSIEFAVQGVFFPAAISLAVVALAQRFLPRDVSQRYAAAAAFAAAYCAGYFLLPKGLLLPERHWHWTFYLAPAAAAIGAISLAAGLRVAERWVLIALAALVAAWLLVPTWDSLAPPRAVWVPVLAGYLFLLAALLDGLPTRLPLATSLALPLSAACVAVLNLACVSATSAQGAGIAAAALAGCFAAACLAPDKAAARGLCLSYSVIVGGWAFVGCIEPEPLMWGLLVAPAAPLVLWCFALPPLSRWRGFVATAVQIGVVMVVLAVAAWLSFASTE
ncbi:MAG: hypothetical protein HYS13_13345 [Planctomycetia bacterium]|nr:hypothetical protein [Planctomycetia bacterium]